MANLNITGNGALIAIALEDFDWVSLLINGSGIEVPRSKDNSFVFSGPSPMAFTAVSTRDITISSPSQNFVLKGPGKSGTSYTLNLDYFPQSEGFNIMGLVIFEEEGLPKGESSPLNFSQDTMNGEFIAV